jgi:glycosyltransferase involved in cell wall biosynthesis
MKIVFISSWFSEGMGYSENMFPKALSKQGVEVHMVTSTAQIYYYLPTYDQVYKPYLGPKMVSPGQKELDGYTLHRLELYDTKNIYRGPGIKGLYEYLEKLKPDVIQTFEIMLETTFIAARYARDHHCLFFTECHTHASVFRLGHTIGWKEKVKKMLNRFNPALAITNKTTRLCYPIAEDVAEIAVSQFMVSPKKIKIQSLGVDTSTFCPVTTPEQMSVRTRIRERFSFGDEDIVCIYTGRFTKDKNPHCLAEAIQLLNERGLPFKGLFVGNGTQADIDFLKSRKGCQIGSFVPAKELPAYYWAADIGVWPREESTSQLDAAASGLPLVLSDQIKVLERVDGNGLLYKEGDAISLAETLLKMKDAESRKRMSIQGIDNVKRRFSWDKIAAERLNDYEVFEKKTNPQV